MPPEVVPTPPKAPAAAEPVTPPVAPAEPPKVEDPKPGDPATEFKSDESKNAVLADLRKEREARQALADQVKTLTESQASQSEAIAKAFGLAETPKTEDLAETVKALQTQFEASQSEATKLRIASEKGVPADYHYLLTETDAEKLTAQAEMAAEYARLKAAADGKPEFQPNPGQGQGGQPLSAEAQAEAEYTKFYPSKS